MNYQYFGLFLNEHNRNELMKIIFANPIIANEESFLKESGFLELKKFITLAGSSISR